jgi:ABC-type glycerol-3-phosphate transport system substrate-binding protein
MTSPAVQKERALRGGPLPSIEKLYADPEVVAFNPDYPRLLQMLRTARRRADIPRYSEVSDALQSNLHRMLKGETSPGECLEALRPDLQMIFDTQ